jgi:diguanylate cyclase (GGDEF)-like protein
MLLGQATPMKKRSLVTTDGLATSAPEPLDAAAQLRALRLEALAQFVPLLAAAAVLSNLVIAATLWDRERPVVLGAWTLVTIAAAWLVTRRIQGNALLFVRRDVPRRIAIENGLMMALLAALWSSLPVSLYAHLPDDLQTIVAGTVCAMMCGALAIATAPLVAMGWAATLTLGLAIGVIAGGDRYWLAMALSVVLHCGFIFVVVQRIHGLSRTHAAGLAANQVESAASARLMREYEEQGSSFLWQTGADHVLSYASPGIAALVGRPSGQLVGTTLPALIGGSQTLGAALAAHAPFATVEVDIDVGGQRRVIAFSGAPVIDSAGVFHGYRGSCSDITVTRSSERRLRQLASLDVLTELPNRLRMRELLGEALLTSRATGRPCCILMLDLDGFKPVNDTFGHPKGDVVLKTVAARLVAAVGTQGIVGRLGGDEFGVVLHDARNRRAVGDLAASLIEAVSEPYVLDRSSVRIGLSIGSATGPIDGDTVDELIRKGDLALYEAKKAGRRTYRAFEQSMQTEAENRLKLEHDLRQALSLGQFHIAYQPLIHARSQEVVGFEALLRWQHPTRGNISPAVFVPLAEEAGLIQDIGEWVLRTATRDCANWPAPVSVAVNLSPLQLQLAHLPAMISDALARARLSANRLEVEVTESVFMGDSDASLDVLRRIRALGVRIALDDFGTGYSSLGYLNRTIFNKLKIDGSFVRDSATRSETVSIIQAIVTLANCFQMTITAEGIETQDDYRRMTEFGCHQMQGYLFGRPVPYARATELVGTARGEAERLARA